MIHNVTISRPATRFLYLLAGVLIFVLTFPAVGGPVRPGLDPSYAFAFNYFFDFQVRIGETILFTLGPLGFLLFPQPIGHNLALAVAATSGLRLALIFALFYLGFLRKNRPPVWLVGLLSACVFITTWLADFGFMLVLLTAVAWLLHRETDRRAYRVGAVFLTAVALLVKSSFGIAALLLTLSYAMILALTAAHATAWRGRGLYAAMSSLIGTTTGVGLALMGLWFLLYRDLSGLGVYLYSMLEFSTGNSSAMTFNGDNNRLALSLCIAAFGSFPFLIKDRGLYFYYALFIPSLWAFWKYAFARPDHLFYFLFYLALFYLLLLVYLVRVKALYVLLMALPLLLFYANMRTVGYDRLYLPEAPGTRNFRTVLMDYANYRRRLLDESTRHLASRVLPPTLRQTMGDRSVDTYPWETSYVAANDLHWRPRPVFQSYTAFTPYLDQKNAAFFASREAPDYLLWELDHWMGPVGSVDHRYLLSDEPHTIRQILSRYKIVQTSERVALWQRSDPLALREPTVIGAGRSAWSRWIETPRVSSGILRARLGITRTVLGRLKRFFYKEGEVYVEYRLDGGDIKKHRLILDNAASGVWISPYVTAIDAPIAGARTTAVRFSHSQDDFFTEDLSIEWEHFDLEFP